MSDITSRFQEILERLAANKAHPHAIMEIQRGDGSVVFSGASGMADADGRPMTTDTPWFIASIDKTMTATLVLQLHEEGLLHIDDKLVDHLPHGTVQGIHTLNGVDHVPTLTLRHLLNHSSGLPDWLEDGPKGGKAFVEELTTTGDRPLHLHDGMELVRRMKPHFAPGSEERSGQRIRYCSTNYMLLNAIIEKRTGQPLYEVFRSRLFAPIRMRHTWLAGWHEPLEAAPDPGMLWFGAGPLEIPQLIKSIHSIYSTGGDLIRFLRAVISGTAFHDPATYALMTGTFNRFGLPMDMAALRNPSWPIEYALGLKRFQIPRWLPPFRHVPAVIGHTGSTGSWLFHCPELDLYIAGTVDQGTAGAVPYRLIPKVLEVMRKAS
jgi:D-alanyl-D-alanine carboxypeptidase